MEFRCFYSHNSESQILQNFSKIFRVIEGCLIISKSLMRVRFLRFLSQNIVSTCHQDWKVFAMGLEGFVVFSDLEKSKIENV